VLPISVCTPPNSSKPSGVHKRAHAHMHGCHVGLVACAGHSVVACAGHSVVQNHLEHRQGAGCTHTHTLPPPHHHHTRIESTCGRDRVGLRKPRTPLSCMVSDEAPSVQGAQGVEGAESCHGLPRVGEATSSLQCSMPNGLTDKPTADRRSRSRASRSRSRLSLAANCNT
jgi:hypothetical protein